MAELDKEILSFLQVILHPVPDAESLNTLRTASVLGIIGHDHICIKMGFKPLSPSTLGILI